MIVMNCTCPQCGGNNFHITQLWNDECETRLPQDWQYIIKITCASCNNETGTVTQMFDDTTVITRQFSSGAPE